MIRLGLHHLETLFWIARLGTFTAAAERLNTTQSAVSGRIRELQNRLNTTLFSKQGRRMVLTARGRELVTSCAPLLNEMERVLMIASAGEAFSGTVRLGAGEIAALSALPEFMVELAQSMPRVSWDIDVDLTINLRQKLESSQLDLALLVGPIDGNFLRSKSIGKVKLVWAASQTFLNKLGHSGKTFTLAAARVWSLSKPSYQYQLTIDVLRIAGFPVQGINTCSNVKTLIELVLKGAGVAMLPDRLVREELRTGVLVPLQSLGASADHAIEFFVVMRSLEDDRLVREVFKRARSVVLR